MRSISISLLFSKLYIYIVIILANFNARDNNSGLDKYFSLKEAITFSYWKDFEKPIHAEFESLIGNDI